MQSVRPLVPEFQEPNGHTPLGSRELLASVPAEASVRGVFFNAIAEELTRAGHAEPQRIAFKWYPLRELMELELRAASLLHPQRSQREGVRRAGWLSYNSLTSTMAGRVLFSVAGMDFRIALTLAGKAYGLSMTRGSCTIPELHRGWARVALRDIFNFVDCYQVGVFEGAMQAYGVRGRVLVHLIDLTNADLYVEWG